MNQASTKIKGKPFPCSLTSVTLEVQYSPVNSEKEQRDQSSHSKKFRLLIENEL